MPEPTQNQARDRAAGPGRRSGNGSQEEHPESHQGKGTSPLEWTVAALSALIVLAAMGTMLYEAISESETPPQIEIAVEDVLEVAGGYLVAFQAYNHGETTAAGLVVEGTLKAGSETVETSSITLDYVPSEGRQRAGLFFSRDPDRFTLEINPKGYSHP